MREMNQKSIDYLNTNPIIKNFIDLVNQKRGNWYESIGLTNKGDLSIEVGNKYIRIMDSNSVWGFISRVDGVLKGAAVRRGDLLKAASWNSPAKHARGNIIDGTAKFDVYGPNYL
jgi:hypothetical protein